ncbi:hypothetical protein RFI_32266, partial [Reticulomyxa filosa]
VPLDVVKLMISFYPIVFDPVLTAKTLSFAVSFLLWKISHHTTAISGSIMTSIFQVFAKDGIRENRTPVQRYDLVISSPPHVALCVDALSLLFKIDNYVLKHGTYIRNAVVYLQREVAKGNFASDESVVQKLKETQENIVSQLTEYRPQAFENSLFDDKRTLQEEVLRNVVIMLNLPRFSKGCFKFCSPILAQAIQENQVRRAWIGAVGNACYHVLNKLFQDPTTYPQHSLGYVWDLSHCLCECIIAYDMQANTSDHNAENMFHDNDILAEKIVSLVLRQLDQQFELLQHLQNKSQFDEHVLLLKRAIKYGCPSVTSEEVPNWLPALCEPL